MKATNCDSYSVKIYIAGPRSKAEDICREFVTQGACINIQDTKFIYTFGEEVGVVVEIIQYPRFPKEIDELFNMAEALGEKLMNEMHQGSYSIVTPATTYLYDRREETK